MSSDGANYSALSYSRTTGTGTNVWAKITPSDRSRHRQSPYPLSPDIHLDAVSHRRSRAHRHVLRRLARDHSVRRPRRTRRDLRLGLDFKGWIGAKFSGADADPDADGLVNLLEFHLGLDPATPDSPAAQGFAFERAGGELRYTYRRSKAQNQYGGRVEWADTLGASVAWSTGGVVDELVTDQGAYELRRARVPSPAEVARRFLRLKVEPTAGP